MTPDGWAALRIGMTRAAFTVAFPDWRFDDAGSPEQCATAVPGGTGGGLDVLFEQGRAARISVSEPAGLGTPEGVTHRTPVAAVRAAYPAGVLRPGKYVDLPAHDYIVWDEAKGRGYRFEIGADGRVAVFHAGTAAIHLVEGCL